jgi:hypothetical protein
MPRAINAIEKELSDPRFVAGFGSVGGEEFFSYLNISEQPAPRRRRAMAQVESGDDRQAADDAE